MRTIHALVVTGAISLLSIQASPAALEESRWFERGLPSSPVLPRGPLEDLGLDAAKVQALMARAEAAQSDALVLVREGRVVVDRRFGSKDEPHSLMSVTKVIAGLAVGMLLDEGRIRSLDEPMSTWFPDWREGPKSAILLRHVLTHTSGLGRGLNGSEINPQADRVAFAAGTPLSDPPGTRWAYNNLGVQLLAKVVQDSAGEPIDHYLAQRLFGPLGIKEWRWSRDRAGNVDTYGGLVLGALDLAKIGQLVLDEGQWQGRRIVSARYLREATTPAGQLPTGLLWFVRYPDAYAVQTPESRERFRRAGFEGADALVPLDGRPFKLDGSYSAEARKLLSSERHAAFQRLLERKVLPVSIHQGRKLVLHEGWLGQYLVIDPDFRLVAVRQIRDTGNATDQTSPARAFKDFLDLVADLGRGSDH